MRAKGFTKKASGLNCTWSMDALTTGFASSSIRVVVTARLAALGTGHSTSRGSIYPSTTPLGRANSRHLVDAEAFFALLATLKEKKHACSDKSDKVITEAVI